MSVQLASVSDELAQAITQRDALQAAADAALLEPRAVASTATKVRKVKALDNPASAELLALIGEAQSVELVSRMARLSLRASVARSSRGMRGAFRSSASHCRFRT
jgi:hypothetical protein